MITYNDISEYVEQGLTPQQIVQELDSVTIDVPNDTAWTLGSMQSVIGQELTYAVSQILKAAAPTNPFADSAFIALSTVGLQLSGDDRQTMIEQLGSGSLSQEDINIIKSLGIVSTQKFPGVTVEQIENLINPPVPDSQSKEILLSVNHRADGTTLVTARITDVFLKDGKVISRGETQSLVNGSLLELVTPVVEVLSNG